MGLVPPNHDAHPEMAVDRATALVTTRNVKAALEPLGERRTAVLPAGTRLRHLRTEYTAECIPPIEYADVHCEVLTSDLAGREIVMRTFEMDAPVPELRRLAQEYGIRVDTTAV